MPSVEGAKCENTFCHLCLIFVFVRIFLEKILSDEARGYGSEKEKRLRGVGLYVYVPVRQPYDVWCAREIDVPVRLRRCLERGRLTKKHHAFILCVHSTAPLYGAVRSKNLCDIFF